jgi:PAS domain S-box-containing protein
MSNPATILAIDDTPEVLGLLVEILSREGYAVRPADSGELALAAVAADPPDLILLDVRMRGIDGIEVCRRLKASDDTRHIPIILISAFADVKEWVAGLQAGAADYICKPFQRVELLTRVKTHLALHHAKAALEEKAAALYQTTTQLEAESARRQRVEDDLRQSLDRAERSRLALLSALEDQKRAEQQMAKSHSLLLNLARLVPGVIYQYRLWPDGRSAFPFSSPGMNDIYEVTPEDVREDATPVFGRLHPEDLVRVREAIQESARTLEEFHCEYRVILPRQGLRWRWGQAHPERTEDGGALWHGIISDITERKQATEALRTEAERLSLILEATSGGVWDWNILSGDATFSPRYTSMLGYTPSEFAESYKDWKQLVHPDDFERVNQEHLDHFHGKKEFSIEYRLREKSGAWHWIHSRGLLIERDSHGNPARMVGTHTDIQGRVQEEKKREQLEAQLLQSQKMEGIGRLAGGVAHDFNNCLNVIQGFTQICISKLPKGDPLADELGEVFKASERAAALTRQLLAFSRKQVLQPETLDLNQVIAELERMLRRTIGEDIELVQLLSPDLGLVKADPGQLGQVIMNLVLNARDAMPNGGKLTIETANAGVDVEYSSHGGEVNPGAHVMLAVTDEGVGMDAATLARLFEPFFTTKGLGKGNGLGLSTAYGIVKQSGGSISVSSEVARGTTVKVYLPRELWATKAMAALPRPTPRRATGSETILVVEDEEPLRRLTRRLLETAGYTVLSAADGEEALLTSERHVGDIDLLLTDVVMPRMNGRLLAERLAKTRPALKILYMSGYTDDAILHHGVLDSGTQFLAKPFSEAELTRKVRAVLDGTLTATGADWPAVKDEVEEPPLDRNTLRALPDDVLARLRKAIIAANYDELVEIIAIVAITQPSVAAALRRMADGFDYNGMLELL